MRIDLKHIPASGPVRINNARHSAHFHKPTLVACLALAYPRTDIAVEQLLVQRRASEIGFCTLLITF